MKIRLGIKHTSFAMSLALMCPFGMAVSQVQDQDHSHPYDYSAMNLEQLINFNVYTASVLSAHIHREGEMMLGYNWARNTMDQLLDNTTKLSSAQLLGNQYGYSVSPVSMNTTMQSFHLMYASSDQLTWILMAKYLNKKMKHQTTATQFTTSNSGWGDTVVKINYNYYHNMAKDIDHQYGLTLGLSLPTGSITSTDVIGQNSEASQLPYAMQLGSGTFDPIIGLSYHGVTPSLYWGAQLIQTSRVSGNNKQGYRLGNQTKLNTWLHYSLNDNLALYTQINLVYQQAISGQDKDIAAMMRTINPMANPRLTRQKKTNIVLGLSYAFTDSLQGNLINIELDRPIYQKLAGPQLSQQQNIKLGWQWLF